MGTEEIRKFVEEIKGADDERIAACLIACHGVDTEDLTPFMVQAMLEQAAEIEDEDDLDINDPELLAELEEMLELGAQHPFMEETGRKRLAKYMGLMCFRNTMLQDLHAGRQPAKLLDQNGDEIPREEASLISNDEIRKLMVEAVNNLYYFVQALGEPGQAVELNKYLEKGDPCPDWNEPEIPAWGQKIIDEVATEDW